jgi:hypothetical protein
MFVPVVNLKNQPLMPTTNWRAAQWIKKNKATPFWSNGIFCVRLNVEPSDTKKQDTVVGIDPGSKREAFTVKSENHTYLNVLADAVIWVKDAVESKRNARRSRRNRKTPCRQNRENRSRGGIPPSTKARWQLKLRIVNRLRRIFPVTDFVVEDIKAKTKEGAKKWNVSFSLLEVGKEWFYSELRKLGNLETREGYETFEMRNALGLHKSKSKMSESFDAHNVDSWVLANWLVGGHTKPDNTEIKRMIPIQFHRRQLHRFQPDKGGERKRYGGTMSLGFKKGSLVKNEKHGLCHIGGSLKNRLSLHDLETGKRLCQNARVEDTRFLTYGSFR